MFAFYISSIESLGTCLSSGSQNCTQSNIYNCNVQEKEKQRELTIHAKMPVCLQCFVYISIRGQLVELVLYAKFVQTIEYQKKGRKRKRTAENVPTTIQKEHTHKKSFKQCAQCSNKIYYNGITIRISSKWQWQCKM